MGDFLTDVQALRARAREHIELGPVTAAYGADLERVLTVLNDALATEIVCALRYEQHHFAARDDPGRRGRARPGHAHVPAEDEPSSVTDTGHTTGRGGASADAPAVVEADLPARRRDRADRRFRPDAERGAPAALPAGWCLMPAAGTNGLAPVDPAQDETSTVLVRRPARRAPGSGLGQLSLWSLAALEDLVMLLISAIAALDIGEVGRGIDRDDAFDMRDNDFCLTV